MSDYCEITLEAPASVRDILLAELSTAGYDAFEETETGLKAYIKQSDFNEDELNIILNKNDIKYSISIIKNQNWNSVWESNFEPVQVDDFVGIRAGFHAPFHGVAHEIVITPKMSFGTGHHATTYLVMKMMQGMDFSGKTVFDFGTGTGILAILAEKLGAAGVTAVDNDDWCIENASENIAINLCKHIDIHKVDAMPIDRRFTIILANINRHIILANLVALKTSLADGGTLVLSGLLTTDQDDIIKECNNIGLTLHSVLTRDGWIALSFF